MGNRQFIVGVVNQKRLPVIPEPPVPPTPVGPEMIMTWNTSNTSAGSSTATQINLPLRAAGNVSLGSSGGIVGVGASDYDFWVDWGDGGGWSDHITGNTDANKLHTYAGAGIKTVKVKGQFGSFHFGQLNADILKLTDISQFDGMIFDNCYQAFKYCANLNFTATDAPVLALNKTTIMGEMFYGAGAFNANIGAWNVSAATNMYYMFSGTIFPDLIMIFNNGGSSSIGSWDTSNVTDMAYMFHKNSAFNQDIGAWDTSKVIYFDSMFYATTNFNNGSSPSISGWTVSAATTIYQMFFQSKINQPIGSWNTANVTNMQYTFGSTPFNQDIGAWNTGKVTSMFAMFTSASAFNQDISAWDVSKVTNMGTMFNGTAFNNGGSPNISGWTVSAVTHMGGMFNGAPFNQNIGAWDVSKVTSFSQMFNAASAFNNGGSPDISGWTINTSSNVDMGWMFRGSPFNQDINAWNVSRVTTLTRMFQLNNVYNKPLGSWNTANVTDMSYMFGSAYLFNQDIGAWNTKKVVNMLEMFNYGYAFNNGGSPSISGWTTSAVTNMNNMFYFTQVFNQDINAWDVRKVTTMYRMFGKGGSASVFNFNGKIYNWQPLALAAGGSTGLGNFYNFSTQAIPTAYYNQLLINWSGLGSLPSSITAGFGGSQWSGATAGAARTTLATTKGWFITDGGEFV